LPRPQKCRRVEFLPGVTYFKPAGIPLKNLEEIAMSVEEAEALRLKDLEGMEQEQGAEKMNVSRPTFQRVLASARQKIADALLNGKAIRIEGGNFEIALGQTRKDRITRIGISATSPNMEADIDPRFGRCRYFIIINPETMAFETLENSGAADGGGAGIATAKSLAGKDLEAVITGNCGPNAYSALTSAGIKVITGVSGTIENAIRDYKAGNLKASYKPNVAGHFGTSRKGKMGGRGRSSRRYQDSEPAKGK
jgi:predicted DNA-binding protein (UPF0251 family)/predicted Fe-Mo cluster-binding NifX family protein